MNIGSSSAQGQRNKPAFAKVQESEYYQFDQVVRKMTRQLNTLEERAKVLRKVSDADVLMRFLTDYGQVLVHVEHRIS